MASQLGPPPRASSEAVSRSMKGNRPKDTSPELQLRKLLREAGFPGYRLHWRVAGTRPDIAYPGRKIAIFVHGCFWHDCPTCKPRLPRTNSEFWERKRTLNRERDARKEAALREAGWDVLTVWECELKERVRLEEKIDERLGH